jgi:hypothetical protein
MNVYKSPEASSELHEVLMDEKGWPTRAPRRASGASSLLFSCARRERPPRQWPSESQRSVIRLFDSISLRGGAPELVALD